MQISDGLMNDLTSSIDCLQPVIIFNWKMNNCKVCFYVISQHSNMIECDVLFSDESGGQYRMKSVLDKTIYFT